jgi:hypothetical protein
LLFTSVLLMAGSAEASVSSPRAFDDDYDAALAVSGDTQWLIVGGVDKQGSRLTYGISAFERTGAGPWQELPPLPGKHFNSASGLRIVVQAEPDPSPCVLYPTDAGPQLQCLHDGAWHDSTPPGIAGANVGDLIAPTPDSMALAYLKIVGHGKDKRVLTYVVRSDSGGPWQRIGKPFEGIIIAQFLKSDTPGPLRVGIELMKRGGANRYVAEEQGGAWVRVTPLDRTREGPFVGGPVTAAGTTYFAATDGAAFPFQFSVLSLAPGGTVWAPVGGGPLSSPTFAGQGTVALANGVPWTIWQEDRERGHSFDSAIRIANLASPEVAPVELWSGKRIGPGPVDLVGGTTMHALYAQGTRKGLRVVVNDLTP